MTSYQHIERGQNGHHFSDDIFRCIFWNENVRISIIISLKFITKVRINHITSMAQLKARHRPCDNPLSEPMMVSSLTHICVTRPQWVKLTVETLAKLDPCQNYLKYNKTVGNIWKTCTASTGQSETRNKMYDIFLFFPNHWKITDISSVDTYAFVYLRKTLQIYILFRYMQMFCKVIMGSN